MKKKSAFAKLRNNEGLSVVNKQRPDLLDENESSGDIFTDDRHFNHNQMFDSCKYFVNLTLYAVQELMLENDSSKEETEDFIAELLNRPMNKNSSVEGFQSIKIGQFIDGE